MKSEIFKCSSIFDKNFLTVQDVSSYLNISSGHAYQLAHRRDFPAMYVGSTIRIPTAPFLAWVEQRCRITKDLDAYLSKRMSESVVNPHVG